LLVSGPSLSLENKKRKWSTGVCIGVEKSKEELNCLLFSVNFDCLVWESADEGYELLPF
jgi:hypothetical protein